MSFFSRPGSKVGNEDLVNETPAQLPTYRRSSAFQLDRPGWKKPEPMSRGVDFDKINKLDESLFGKKVQLTSGKTIDIKVPDPFDADWMVQYNNRRRNGESDDQIRSNPPFNRPQRTIVRRLPVNRLFSTDPTLKLETRLTGIEALMEEQVLTNSDVLMVLRALQAAVLSNGNRNGDGDSLSSVSSTTQSGDSLIQVDTSLVPQLSSSSSGSDDQRSQDITDQLDQRIQAIMDQLEVPRSRVDSGLPEFITYDQFNTPKIFSAVLLHLIQNEMFMIQGKQIQNLKPWWQRNREKIMFLPTSSPPTFITPIEANRLGFNFGGVGPSFSLDGDDFYDPQL